MTYPLLKEAIKTATRKTYQAMLAYVGDEQIYYFVLTTVGEALSPGQSAWTEQLLEEKTQQSLGLYLDNYEALKDDLRWSYSDSPLFCFGAQYFEPVTQLFLARPELTYTMSDEAWEKEYQFRISEMTQALIELDEEGLFGVNA
ncbi:DUF4303 domain-containing protein [Suttonella sp. R2A3]|uniref:DUF4303 domain-containing protein n=1 Tax=Suttonella sp. R2A3 TaxID=2908648 RepID=UPI001F352062|nr:DUF4303 domain-containing protein [Suttonella sp. R2A3]UJF25224.1 DUF4303 domain-containing protein [Suttonella sp. R2A3]